MRVYLGQAQDFGISYVLCPQTRVSQVKTLVGREPVDVFLIRVGFFSCLERSICNAESSLVGDVFAQSETSVGVDCVEDGVFMSEEVMDEMRRRGAYLVPTLSAPYYAVEEGLRREPNNPDHLRSKSVVQRHRDMLKKCAERGVNIAFPITTPIAP